MPVIHNQCGGNAEADHVGQAVELLAERALAVGQTCHAPVHAVQHHGDEYGHGGAFKASVHGLGDGEKCGKQGGDGERVGQQVNAVLAQRLHFACHAGGFSVFVFCLHDDFPMCRLLFYASKAACTLFFTMTCRANPARPAYRTSPFHGRPATPPPAPRLRQTSCGCWLCG